MKRPVGIFDSGIGGLTVLGEQKKRLPGEDYIYFGDTGRVPYGNKGKTTVTRYSIEIANYLLINHDIKALIVACNTASSLAVDTLKKLYKIPVFEVITPASRRALENTKNGRIGVIGTSSTVRSGTYREKIESLDGTASVLEKACPLFVPLVEEGWLSHTASRMIVEEYLEPLKEEDIDTLILGCTHYPFLIGMIQECMGGDVSIVDSATHVAIEVEHYLRENGLVTPEREGTLKYIVTDDGGSFMEHGVKLLGKMEGSVMEVTL